jgi:predicted DNA-binding transcriptional regulator AlpA
VEINRDYLNILEVAELLRISRNRAYDIAASDLTFPVIRIGRRLIVSREDLRRWLNDQRRDLLP